MERKIYVTSTKTQSRYVITTNAETLGELKKVLTDNNIDYENMSFTEGVSKTMLTDDNAPLPSNISYKGKTTNDLVILLTNTRKKVASGMDRAALYKAIKDANLQGRIKAAYGRNYTLVPSEQLAIFLRESNYRENAQRASQPQTLVSNVKIMEHVGLAEIIRSSIVRMHQNGCLSTDDLSELHFGIGDYLDNLDDKDNDVYSEQDINKMISDL